MASLRGRANPFLTAEVTCSDEIKQAKFSPSHWGGDQSSAQNKGHGDGKWDYGMKEDKRKSTAISTAALAQRDESNAKALA